MPPKTSFVLALFFLTGCAFFTKIPADNLNVEKLTPTQIAEVKTLVSKLEPFMKKKDEEGKLPSLTFKQLESPLSSTEKKFLCSFRDLKAGETGVRIPFRGFSQGEKDLVRLKDQKIRLKGKDKILPPQFLSPQVYQAYRFMNRAMEREIGKRIFIESAYRSSAYQLYLFIYYLSNHDYSIRETAKWVALPGYSEHGDPDQLAIDFINADGINGEENVAEFEALQEYQWLLINAGRFGFVLSYPKDAGTGITYEPWHWRYEGIRYTPANLNPVSGTRSSTPRIPLPFREPSPSISTALRSSQQGDPRSQVRLPSADTNHLQTALGTKGNSVTLSNEQVLSAGA
jgi:LAS superfamily LD-carboxypeptidase LdcB